MATVTDTLETVLQLTGTQQMVAGLNSAANATKGLADADASATAATGGLKAAMAGLLPTIGKLAATIGLAKVAHDIVTDFGEAELAVVRIGVTMKNLGNVFPTNELLKFASALSKTTGIDDELIATLGATAAQFGLTRQQIEKLLPTVLDVAQIKGIAPQQVLQTLLRASRGRPQGLVALGIDPGKIKGDLKDINNLVQQISEGFKGGAEAVRNTLPGTLEALKTSIQNLFEATGALFGGELKQFLNNLIYKIDKLTEILNFFAQYFGKLDVLRRPVGSGTPAAGGGGALALKGDPEQTGYLRDIASNTGKQAEKLAREVLGGPGTVAGGAVNWRDFNMAMGV